MASKSGHRKKRILFLFSNFHLKDVTGQPGTIWQLIKHLPERYEAFVISNADEDRNDDSGPIHLRLFRSTNNQLLDYLSRLPYFLKSIWDINPDLIHAHGLPILVFAFLLNCFYRKPLIFSFNEDIGLRPRWLQKAIACCARKSSGIVASCEHFRKCLLDLNVPDELITVVPFGLREEFLQKPDPVTEEYDFLYYGDASRNRGFDIVCNLADALPESTFRILIRRVDESGRVDYEKVRNLSNVTILHYPYEEDLRTMIQKARVTILPYRSTSAILPPMTLAESMALGKCVITTELVGTDQLCDDAKTVYFLDVKGMDRTIHLAKRLICQAPDRELVGLNARRRIEDVFTKQYNSFFSLYERATGL
jgi:glycosyltransferase involved in cell wall biosynthesis